MSLNVYPITTMSRQMQASFCHEWIGLLPLPVVFFAFAGGLFSLTSLTKDDVRASSSRVWARWYCLQYPLSPIVLRQKTSEPTLPLHPTAAESREPDKVHSEGIRRQPPSLRGALIAGPHEVLLKRKREREHAKDDEE